MQNLPKRWEIFISKKGCEGVYRFPKIFPWFCRKMMVEMVVGCGSADGEDKSREKHMREWKKERKEVKWKSWPKRENGQCENEWLRMMGSGVRWGTWELKKIWPWPFFFFFCWLGRYTFHKATGNKRYLIVNIDYFTKWVKAKPLANIKDVDAKRFV